MGTIGSAVRFPGSGFAAGSGGSSVTEKQMNLSAWATTGKGHDVFGREKGAGKP